MGEDEGWAEPSRFLPNGLLPNAARVGRILDSERWLKAEERTAELMACIQPNPPSKGRRKAVVDYVQRLITKCFPCQVFTFGSVPLKSYLPDDGIDLVVLSNSGDTWANDVCDMPKCEEENENAEFRVKRVHYIQANVKIIKCLVENIDAEISFNQLGGLCSLCFLEEVDSLIAQNHLFKHSIILIKAWCSYESRILGAHDRLISTYALETLVLYIFHVFNNSFAGPLEVLYRFLEFFSNFDWDNFCVSLWGPVPIRSLPDMTAEHPRKDTGELLLTKLFLDACSSVYAVLPSGQENQGQHFVCKHCNVIDPLCVNNNLGCSVSKGNFLRIHSAFVLGAKSLTRLLDCPKENLVYEVNQFFIHTWDRHGSGNRRDAPRTDLRYLTLSTPHQLHRPENLKNTPSAKTLNENSLGRDDREGKWNDDSKSRAHQRHHSESSMNNTGGLPFAFYLTGPPVPFLTNTQSAKTLNVNSLGCDDREGKWNDDSKSRATQRHHSESSMSNAGGLPFGFYPTGPPVTFLTNTPSAKTLNENSHGRDDREGKWNNDLKSRAPQRHHSESSMSNTGGLPFAFYPAGPSLPFLTMVPFYNVPPEMRTSDSSTSHFSGEDNWISSEEIDHSEQLSTASASTMAAFVETGDEHRSKIFLTVTSLAIGKIYRLGGLAKTDISMSLRTIVHQLLCRLCTYNDVYLGMVPEDLFQPTPYSCCSTPTCSQQTSECLSTACR